MKQINFAIIIALMIIGVLPTQAQKVLKQVIVLQMPEGDGSNSAAVAGILLQKNITPAWLAMLFIQWAFLMKKGK